MNPHEPTEAELQAEAQELEALAAQLRAELQAEPALPLREEQRAAIFAATAGEKITTGPKSWWRRGSLIGAAAGLAVGVLGTATVLQMQHLQDLRTLVGQTRTAEARGLSIQFVDEPTLNAAPEEVTAPAPGQPTIAQATPAAIRLELPSFPSAPVLPPAPTVLPVRSALAGEPANVVPAPRVDPASIPFVGHAPKDLPRSTVKDRAAAKTSPTPKR